MASSISGAAPAELSEAKFETSGAIPKITFLAVGHRSIPPYERFGNLEPLGPLLGTFGGVKSLESDSREKLVGGKLGDHFGSELGSAFVSIAIDVFENVLSDHPDANFLDVILFNYGRCLYKLERKPEARRKFEQLINDYPESEIATEANKIVGALKKAGF